MVVLREGFEAFLIVAIILAYLHKTVQTRLVRAALWGIAGSVVLSGFLGWILWLTQGANRPLWEGIFGVVTVILVGALVAHMWRVGPKLKEQMERRLAHMTEISTGQTSFLGVFVFTLFMITREGMETALLLFQIHEPKIVTGIVLGIFGAGAMAYVWYRCGYLVNLKHFFRVTAVFLLLFTVQISVQAFHEFTEAGIFPNSEALHVASEPYSMEGVYGKWFQWLSFLFCGGWLIGVWFLERVRNGREPKTALFDSEGSTRPDVLSEGVPRS